MPRGLPAAQAASGDLVSEGAGARGCWARGHAAPRKGAAGEPGGPVPLEESEQGLLVPEHKRSVFLDSVQKAKWITRFLDATAPSVLEQRETRDEEDKGLWRLKYLL